MAYRETRKPHPLFTFPLHPLPQSNPLHSLRRLHRQRLPERGVRALQRHGQRRHDHHHRNVLSALATGRLPDVRRHRLEAGHEAQEVPAVPGHRDWVCDLPLLRRDGDQIDDARRGGLCCWGLLVLGFSLVLRVVEIEIKALVSQRSASFDECSHESKPGISSQCPV